MTITVYGIPSCDTCRKARAWLTARGAGHAWVDLRAAPPAAGKVAAWVSAFGAKALRNTSGGSFRALGPEKDGFGDAEWSAAFARDPMLIKRPVLEIEGRPAAVGFKPDVWEKLLGTE